MDKSVFSSSSWRLAKKRPNQLGFHGKLATTRSKQEGVSCKKTTN